MPTSAAICSILCFYTRWKYCKYRHHVGASFYIYFNCLPFHVKLVISSLESGHVFTKLFRIRIKIRLKLTIILLWTFLKPTIVI